MTARATGRVSSRARPVVLVFGESINDARAVASLIQALCPQLEGRVRALPRPTSLQRAASAPKVAGWINRLHGAVLAHRQPVACVFVHRDADGPDPTAQLARATQAMLTNAGLQRAYAVVPTCEIESWWLAFPTATESLRTSWSGVLPKTPGRVDSILDPKRRLARLTGRKNPRHGYSEADSPAVARQVANAIAAGVQPSGHSPSYRHFVRSVGDCCSSARATQ